MNGTELVGWVPPPHAGRSTLSLLYSCLSTIFLCTWTALHMQVPADDDTKWTIFFRKLRWMVAAIFAPEVIFFQAIGEFLDARELVREVNSTDLELSGSGSAKAHGKWTLTHGFFVTMGGFALDSSDGVQQRLCPRRFLHAARCKIIDIPGTSVRELEDKSRADLIVKSITCLQILYFVTQLIGRAAQRLSCTPLELFTLGIILCTLATYACWWHKPLGVQVPILVPPLDAAVVEVPEIWDGSIPAYVCTNHDSNARVSLLDVCEPEKKPIKPMYATGAFVICIFGACHIIGWSNHFPTESERILWRVASLLCSGIPILFGSVALLLPDKRYCRFFNFTSINDVVFALLYPVVRLYLLIAVFISLRSVPASVYQEVQWSRYVPHIA